MTNQNQQVAQKQDKFPIKTLFESPNVKQKLQELLNK
ncbi:TPA: recombinase, partial [Mannheimia haemolytica]|nr:recombinase [Mannheimia haemolytica]